MHTLQNLNLKPSEDEFSRLFRFILCLKMAQGEMYIILSDKRHSELFLLPINQLESISHTSCPSAIIPCIHFI